MEKNHVKDFFASTEEWVEKHNNIITRKDVIIFRVGAWDWLFDSIPSSETGSPGNMDLPYCLECKFSE